MWMKYLAIAICFIAVSTTSLIASATQPSLTRSPSAIGQQECIARILNEPSIQSANITRNYLVTIKRGRRRSFEDRYPDVGDPIIQAGESGRTLPIIVVDDITTATMVRNEPITMHIRSYS